MDRYARRHVLLPLQGVLQPIVQKTPVVRLKGQGERSLQWTRQGRPLQEWPHHITPKRLLETERCCPILRKRRLAATNKNCSVILMLLKGRGAGTTR